MYVVQYCLVRSTIFGPGCILSIEAGRHDTTFILTVVHSRRQLCVRHSDDWQTSDRQGLSLLAKPKDRKGICEQGEPTSPATFVCEGRAGTFS